MPQPPVPSPAGAPAADAVDAALRAFVVDELLFGDPAPGPDDDLFETGVLDSMGLLRLLAFAAEAWGVQIPPAELRLEAFQTLRRAAATLRAAGAR